MGCMGLLVATQKQNQCLSHKALVYNTFIKILPLEVVHN